MEVINNECYVSFEIANLLKKAGFDWDTYNDYNKDGVFADKNRNLITWNHFSDYYSAPTLDVAQRWLREVKDFHIFVEYDNSIYQCRIDQMEHIYYVKHREWLYNNAFNEFSTYEEAQEAGIKKALEIILEEEE
jgi:hypothetical protein